MTSFIFLKCTVGSKIIRAVAIILVIFLWFDSQFLMFVINKYLIHKTALGMSFFDTNNSAADWNAIFVTLRTGKFELPENFTVVYLQPNNLTICFVSAYAIRIRETVVL